MNEQGADQVWISGKSESAPLMKRIASKLSRSAEEEMSIPMDPVPAPMEMPSFSEGYSESEHPEPSLGEQMGDINKLVAEMDEDSLGKAMRALSPKYEELQGSMN